MLDLELTIGPILDLQENKGMLHLILVDSLEKSKYSGGLYK